MPNFEVTVDVQHLRAALLWMHDESTFHVAAGIVNIRRREERLFWQDPATVDAVMDGRCPAHALMQGQARLVAKNVALGGTTECTFELEGHDTHRMKGVTDFLKGKTGEILLSSSEQEQKRHCVNFIIDGKTMTYRAGFGKATPATELHFPAEFPTEMMVNAPELLVFVKEAETKKAGFMKWQLDAGFNSQKSVVTRVTFAVSPNVVQIAKKGSKKQPLTKVDPTSYCAHEGHAYKMCFSSEVGTPLLCAKEEDSIGANGHVYHRRVFLSLPILRTMLMAQEDDYCTVGLNHEGLFFQHEKYPDLKVVVFHVEGVLKNDEGDQEGDEGRARFPLSDGLIIVGKAEAFALQAEAFNFLISSLVKVDDCDKCKACRDGDGERTAEEINKGLKDGVKIEMRQAGRGATPLTSAACCLWAHSVTRRQAKVLLMENFPQLSEKTASSIFEEAMRSLDATPLGGWPEGKGVCKRTLYVMGLDRKGNDKAVPVDKDGRRSGEEGCGDTTSHYLPFMGWTLKPEDDPMAQENASPNSSLNGSLSEQLHPRKKAATSATPTASEVACQDDEMLAGRIERLETGSYSSAEASRAARLVIEAGLDVTEDRHLRFYSLLIIANSETEGTLSNILFRRAKSKLQSIPQACLRATCRKLVEAHYNIDPNTKKVTSSKDSVAKILTNEGFLAEV